MKKIDTSNYSIWIGEKALSKLNVIPYSKVAILVDKNTKRDCLSKLPKIENPFKEILWSDFVISRAGALTLSEIISLKRGALIIPLPSSIDNHQALNAESIQRMNLGITHYQEESLEKLVTRLKSIIDNKTFMSWKKLGLDIHINASKMILDIIEDYEFK